MKPAEDLQAEAPYLVGEGEWEPKSALPDMWEVMHQCENAGLNSNATRTIVHWYIFFKQHNAATLEEFLGKFAEGAEKKDFFEFSKYCIALYRKVHEMQLASGLNPIEEALVREQMEGAVDMDQLGDEYHEDPKNDYWQRRASIVGPDFRELPRSYVKLMGSYDSFEEFREAHKKFDGWDMASEIQDQMMRIAINKRSNDSAGKARTVLGK